MAHRTAHGPDCGIIRTRAAVPMPGGGRPRVPVEGEAMSDGDAEKTKAKAKLAQQGMRAMELTEPGEVKRRVKARVKGAAGSVALHGIAAIGRLAGRRVEEAPPIDAEFADPRHDFDAWDARDGEDFEHELRRKAALRQQEQAWLAAAGAPAAPATARPAFEPPPARPAARPAAPGRSSRRAAHAPANPAAGAPGASGTRGTSRASGASVPPGTPGTSGDLASLRRSFPEPARELALLIFKCVDLLDELASDGAPAPEAAELSRREALLGRIAALIAPKADGALLAFVDHVIALSRNRPRG